MAYRPASLKVRALQWLAQREHSRAELRVRLLRAAAGRPVPASVQVPELADTAEDLLDDGGTPAHDGNDCDADVAPADPTDHAPEVDALLDWLSARGYLSDQRFIDSRIHTRQRRYGNLRIERELAQHGLAPDAEARQQLRDSELSRAQEVWLRRYGEIATGPAERLRQMRFLAGRGFSSEVIRRVVRGSSDDD